MHRNISQLLLAATASLALAGSARADGDVVQRFEMLGTLHSGTEIGGTLVVDLTTGRAIAANIRIYGQQPYNFDHIGPLY